MAQSQAAKISTPRKPSELAVYPDLQGTHMYIQIT